MISGKTTEEILISGTYYCYEHPDTKINLIKGDQFPNCTNDESHQTVWMLDSKKKEGSRKELTEEEEHDKDDYNGNQSQFEKNIINNENLKQVYNRVGFYAATISKGSHGEIEYDLQSTLKIENELRVNEIDFIQKKHEERLEIVKKELDGIAKLIYEKEDIKKKFEDNLQKMQIEHENLCVVIKDLYVNLRDQIKDLGTTKEELVSKRIEEFEKEITKLVNLYQELEDSQNNKFRKDFEFTDITDRDKKFYYDYKEKLEDSFQGVHKRVKALEREGLNRTISKLLISLGWIAAFISSWFFETWYTNAQGLEPTSSSSGLITYILDNIRYFIFRYPWYVSLSTFLVYLLVVMLISFVCYKVLRREGFIKTNNKEKVENNDDEQKIELNPENDEALKVKFNASTWYELWLHITPILSSILLLIIILALGSYGRGEYRYEDLSNILSVQLIGLMFPISFTVLGFLFIINVIEKKSISDENSEKNDVWMGRLFSLPIVFFLLLIVLLLAVNVLKLGGTGMSYVGGFGFFIGCISTGLAFAYGYRYLSLKETFMSLVQTIHGVNQYIERWFYPYEASYLKRYAVQARMHKLFHSAADLIHSRNELAKRLLIPEFFLKGKEKKNTISKPQYIIVSDSNEDVEKDHNKDKKESTKKESGFLNKLISLVTGQGYDDKEKPKYDNQEDLISDEERIYFPLASARINEIKFLIKDREKRMDELKEEIDGYYRNEKTYASLNQQIENLYTKQSQLAKGIESMELDVVDRIKEVNDVYILKRNYIFEGNTIGLWFNNNTDK